jgi:GMP synthase (glutamine-hydrolysing)
MKPILVIEQDYSLRGLGLLGERLDASGLPYRSLRTWDESVDAVDVRDVAAVIPMGGTGHAWQADSVPVLATQQRMLREAVEIGVPVFGICLGGQLLAGALGGKVRPTREPERGWLEIKPSERAADDPIFRILERATGVYSWHEDVFDPPAGSTVLASTAAAPNQAFRVDGADAWGIQFHPETTPELWELWVARHPKEVQEAGVDVEAMRREVYTGSEASLPFRTAMFDAFIDRVRSTHE